METPTLIREIETLADSASQTVDGLCKELGINRSTWQRWKGGQSEPHLNHYRSLLRMRDDLRNKVTGQAA